MDSKLTMPTTPTTPITPTNHTKPKVVTTSTESQLDSDNCACGTCITCDLVHLLDAVNAWECTVKESLGTLESLDKLLQEAITTGLRQMDCQQLGLEGEDEEKEKDWEMVDSGDEEDEEWGVVVVEEDEEEEEDEDEDEDEEDEDEDEEQVELALRLSRKRME